LGKVDGGRCRNAKPTLSRMIGALIDTDLAGAYASSMSPTPIIIGKPRMCEYGDSVDQSKLRNTPSLAEWLKEHEKRLLDRHWILKISTIEPFTFENDLIASWYDFSIATKKTDTELEGNDTKCDPSSGLTTIFSREIINGSLTSDLLDVARNTMSNKQFIEWCDKIHVRAGLYTYKDDFIQLSDFIDKYTNDTLSEYDYTSVTIGALISDIALANRKRHKKGTVLNNLFKLLSNTSYGVLVSRFFTTSSVITAGNVTGTVRAMMFLVEKGLNLMGSITDGQLFDLNQVLYPKHYSQPNPNDTVLNTRAYTLTGKELNNAHGSYRPLIGNRIEIDNDDTFGNDYNASVILRIYHDNDTDEILRGKEAFKRIDDAAIAHLQNLFPKVKLIKEKFNIVKGLNSENDVDYTTQQSLFRFESKAFVKEAAFHGSANYLHTSINPLQPDKVAMRSYESNSQHQSFSFNKSDVVLSDVYADVNPATLIMNAIKKGKPFALLPPFVKTRILKPSTYLIGQKYLDSIIEPADSVLIVGLPRLFSLSQFTYQTRFQRDKWKWANNLLKNRHGFSFELWFLDAKGLLDFDAMIETIDRLIVDGVTNPISQLTKLRGTPSIPKYVDDYNKAIAYVKKNLNDWLIDDSDNAVNDSEDNYGGYTEQEKW